jgi:hypothetical protein
LADGWEVQLQCGANNSIYQRNADKVRMILEEITQRLDSIGANSGMIRDIRGGEFCIPRMRPADKYVLYKEMRRS